MARIALLLEKKNIGELIQYAYNIHTRMTAEAAVFTLPPVPMADFKASIDQLSDDDQATIGTGRIARAQRKASILKLQAEIRKLAAYVQIVSDGDENIILSAGFDIARRGPRRYIEIAVPVDLRVQYTSQSEARLLWNKVVNARGYKVEYCEDPITEDGWKQAPFTSSSRMTIGALNPLKRYYFRVAALGAGTLQSNWSDVALLSLV